jgi:hypothetical protein
LPPESLAVLFLNSILGHVSRRTLGAHDIAFPQASADARSEFQHKTVFGRGRDETAGILRGFTHHHALVAELIHGSDPFDRKRSDAMDLDDAVGL